MQEAHWTKDTKQEVILREFMETYCYPRFYDSVRFTNQSGDQFQGTDYFLDGTRHDLKAQTKKYICRPTKTFALEIAGFGKDHVWKRGWFTKKMLTEFYDWLWIHKAKFGYLGPATYIERSTGEEKECLNNRFVFSPDDIYHVEVMVVNAAMIHEAILKEYGFNQDDLYDIACDMRHRLYDYNPTCKDPAAEEHNGLKFVFSPWLEECPVNVVINKEWYQRFSPLYYEWDKGLIIPHSNNIIQEKRCPQCYASLIPHREGTKVVRVCANECGYTDTTSAQ